MTHYLYDGTFDGFLTAIFYAYPKKEEVHIYKEVEYNPSLLAQELIIKSESDKADRVYQSIESKLSFGTLNNLYRLHLCSDIEADTLGLQYLKLCYQYSDTINLAKNNDIIRKVNLLCKQISKEVHRYYGFVRFKEIAPMIFYAPIEPDHNILPLMMSHFKSRFADQHFIIHDLKRNAAIVYDTNNIRLQFLSPDEAKQLASANIKDPFEAYFKTYFDATTIHSRLNPRQQSAYMPKRYYKHLVEV